MLETSCKLEACEFVKPEKEDRRAYEKLLVFYFGIVDL